LKSEYEAHQKIPRFKNSYSNILQQMSKLYTPIISDLFQNEYQLFETCFVKNMNIQKSPLDFVIGMSRDSGEGRVSFDLDKNLICRSCRKFGSFGNTLLSLFKSVYSYGWQICAEHYILKRWTKVARNGDLHIIGISDLVAVLPGLWKTLLKHSYVY